MNGAQLAFFRYRLQQIERELLSNADETTEHLRETVIVPDPADRATIEEEHALELRTRDRERKLLKKVQGSLAQIEAGEYGYCEETGEPDRHSSPARPPNGDPEPGSATAAGNQAKALRRLSAPSSGMRLRERGEDAPPRFARSPESGHRRPPPFATTGKPPATLAAPVTVGP